MSNGTEYTVLLGVPGFVSQSEGMRTHLSHVNGNSVEDAIVISIEQAVESYDATGEGNDAWTDWIVLLVVQGWQSDLTPTLPDERRLGSRVSWVVERPGCQVSA